MAKKTIPDEVKQQVTQIVERFNRKKLARSGSYYTPRWQGAFLYLDRDEYGTLAPICRLKYTGDMSRWEFAIFKYSSERYSPSERWFPGAEYVDGTIEGAMKAGMQAYS
jgi:hypothetical protein